MSNIKNIWIESEENGPIQGGISETNDNSDVIVTFENGEKSVATFFTYQNIDWLRQKNQKTGECLNGKYFWARDILLIERLDRKTIETVVEELIGTNEFNSVFTKIEIENSVWIFNGANSKFSGGVFNNLDDAEKWIKENNLTGMLTKYPLNQGVFDWAKENDLINMKPEKLEQMKNDPIFVGGFTTASMEHYHYENGE